MKAEETVTFRLPSILKKKVAEIGDDNGLTMSKAFVQLLLKGVATYQEDGVLVGSKNREVMQSLENPQPQPEVIKPQKRQAG